MPHVEVLAMRSFIRSRLTYANVTATLALFVALGGVGYAAATLPKNSVGTAQIKKDAVTGAKVKNSSLTGNDIKDNSLTARDFNGSVQGPQGVQGPRGVQGPQGDQGLKGDTGLKGDPGPLLDVLPSGRTLIGVYDIGTNAGATGWTVGASVTYAVPMPARLTPHYITMGGTPPAGCTGGTAAAPKAAAGHLCLFEAMAVQAKNPYIADPQSNTANQTSLHGFSVGVQSTQSGFFGARGAWAATAP